MSPRFDSVTLAYSGREPSPTQGDGTSPRFDSVALAHSGREPSPMTVKIFNDDPDHYIFPVLTTGKGPVDIWLEAFFMTPKKDVDSNNYHYPRNYNFRIYIVPGIEPWQDAVQESDLN
jgi:hypothetical protein